MKNRVMAILLTSTLVIGSLAGCSGGSGSSESTASSGSSAETSAEASGAGEEIHIGVVLSTLASEYWQYVKAGVQAYADEHDNVTVTINAPSSFTGYDEQLNMIETAVTSGGYDGMVISPLQPQTAATIIADIQIPVVAVNTDLDCEESLCFVGTGNVLAAKEGAIAAVELAREAGWEEITAINIAGILGDTNQDERTQGFQEGVEEAGGVFLADEIQYADCVADKAVTSMEAIMQNHPEGISIIICNNDDMAIAAAGTAAGNSAYENTVFVGFDGIQSACESILEGGETMSIAQDPYMMGYKAVEQCVAAIGGETLDEFVDTGCAIITADNAQEQLDKLVSYVGKAE